MSMKFQFVPVFIAGLMLGAILAEVKRDVSLIKTAPRQLTPSSGRYRLGHERSAANELLRAELARRGFLVRGNDPVIPGS